MNRSLVSVCIPCHNAAPYVGEAIESILNQTWQRIEVIVVNDSSSDNSQEVLAKYHRLNSIKVIDATFASAAKSRNLAYTAAKGDWIKFFDADDLLSPDAIEAQVNRLKGRRDAVASARWGRFYDNDLASFVANQQDVWRDMKGTDWLINAWSDAQPMMQPGLFLIPREILEKTGGWNDDLTLIDDFEFFARVLCNANDVLFTPEATLYYRSGLPSTLSGDKSRRAWESAYRSLLLGTGHLLKRRENAEARKACANILQNFIYAIYPDHRDLIDPIEQRIAELGGSDLQMPAGPRLRALQRLLGWRRAKRLQRLIWRN